MEKDYNFLPTIVIMIANGAARRTFRKLKKQMETDNAVEDSSANIGQEA